jgi:hypothetical protein
MVPLIPVIAGAVGTVVTLLTRHPIVTKMLVFTFFVGILTSASAFVLGLVTPYMSAFPYWQFASWLGINNALSLYFSILISGWGVKQVLSFIKV